MQQTKKVSPLILSEQLACLNKHKSTLICTTEQCKEYAFLCSNQDCQCFKTKHFKCNLNILNFIFTAIQSHKKQMSADIKQAFQSVLQLYDKMIWQLSQDREKFINMADNFGLGENMISFLNLINEGNAQQINGDLAFKVKSEMGNVVSRLQIQSVQSIMNKWKKHEKQFQQVQNLFKEYRFTTASFLIMQSKLMNREGQQKIKAYFKKNIKNLELIFRASQHNWKAAAFHQKCDGVSNTLVLAQTQYGTFVGGFTPLEWKSLSSIAQKDPSKQSFLFSLTLNQKYQLKDHAFAIEQDRTTGPVFGLSDGSRDFGIMDNCTITNSWTNFPSAYNNGRYQKNQQSFTKFCGNPSGKVFKIKDYEVFKVHFK